MSDHRAHVVYRRLLSRTGNGYPLWIPNPDENLSAEYQTSGISIGDVGLLTADGGFDFLFNVHASSADPVNDGGAPPDFHPLLLDDPYPIRKTAIIHKKESAITSADVAKAQYSLGGIGSSWVCFPHSMNRLAPDRLYEALSAFSTSRAEAAILILPNGAHRYVAKNIDKYERHRTWHCRTQQVSNSPRKAPKS